MKLARIYIVGAICIGILQIIDGTLLVLNEGLFNNFNLIVALIELTWFFISITFIFVFRILKLSILSPLSFAAYITLGWTIATIGNSSQSADVTTVSVGFAIVGALFGLFYVIINERLRGKW